MSLVEDTSKSQNTNLFENYVRTLKYDEIYDLNSEFLDILNMLSSHNLHKISVKKIHFHEERILNIINENLKTNMNTYSRWLSTKEPGRIIQQLVDMMFVIRVRADYLILEHDVQLEHIETSGDNVYCKKGSLVTQRLILNPTTLDHRDNSFSIYEIFVKSNAFGLNVPIHFTQIQNENSAYCLEIQSL